MKEQQYLGKPRNVFVSFSCLLLFCSVLIIYGRNSIPSRLLLSTKFAQRDNQLPSLRVMHHSEAQQFFQVSKCFLTSQCWGDVVVFHTVTLLSAMQLLLLCSSTAEPHYCDFEGTGIKKRIIRENVLTGNHIMRVFYRSKLCIIFTCIRLTIRHPQH